MSSKSGMFMVIDMISEEGNIFQILGKAVKTLEEEGCREIADELCRDFYKNSKHLKSYEEALKLIEKYITILRLNEPKKEYRDEMGEYHGRNE